MPLATAEDANGWLDGTKLAFADDNDAADDADNADTIVRAHLSGVYPDGVDTWDIESNNVPDTIKEIASLLMASYKYAKVYSEDVESESSYAARLESRAMRLLDDLKTGVIVLHDSEESSGIAFDDDDFHPSDDTDRKFTMDSVF